MKSCIRLINGIAKDIVNSEAVWVNMGVKSSSPKFASDTNSSATFKQGQYLFNYSEDVVASFSGDFTVAFWAKFEQGAITDEVYGNRLMLILDNTVISGEIPSSVIVTDWNYYTIIRDGNTIKLNANTLNIASVENTNVIDFSNTAYIYLGNDNPTATGYNVTTDDIFMFDGVLDISTLPDGYLDMGEFKYCLYIEVATGKIYGYKEDEV